MSISNAKDEAQRCGPNSIEVVLKFATILTVIIATVTFAGGCWVSGYLGQFGADWLAPTVSRNVYLYHGSEIMISVLFVAGLLLAMTRGKFTALLRLLTLACASVFATFSIVLKLDLPSWFWNWFSAVVTYAFVIGSSALAVLSSSNVHKRVHPHEWVLWVVLVLFGSPLGCWTLGARDAILKANEHRLPKVTFLDQGTTATLNLVFADQGNLVLWDIDSTSSISARRRIHNVRIIKTETALKIQ